MVKIKKRKVKLIISGTELPNYRGTVNPYIGCEYGCLFCGASFICRFTDHVYDLWGEFVDVKVYKGRIPRTDKLILSSVTDPYQPAELKHEVTKKFLEKYDKEDAEITVSTRSDLVVRDIELFKKFKTKVIISVCTLDEELGVVEGRTPSFERRLEALKTLHENGIYTVLAISPMFPYLCDYKKIVELTRPYADEFIFENLKLKHPYKSPVLDFIEMNFNRYYEDYREIYVRKDSCYWDDMREELEKYCEENNLKYTLQIN